MKITSGKFKAILLAFIFVGYSGCLIAQQDEIDKAWKGSGNSRTWVVTDAEPTIPKNGFHMNAGDAFRIEKLGQFTRLVPLHTLPARWGLQGNVFIDLEKTKGTGTKRLCGEFEIKGHVGGDHSIHYIVIDPPGHGNNASNVLEIIIANPDEGPCDNLVFTNHGGRAHAVN